MTGSKSSMAATPARKTRRFFEKQLPGEQPLSFETADQLYQLAMALLAIEPWEFLEDQDLILMEDPQSKEICYCSIMGALGEVFSIQVYVGAESYRFFRKIASGAPITIGEFFASYRGVSTEFVVASEQTPPDRELLQAFGHPKKRGGRAPIFRASRPGYHPWYVTEGEAKILIYCMQGTLAFCRSAMAMDAGDFWENEDVFPFLTPDLHGKVRERCEMQLVKAPEPPSVKPRVPELDEDLIADILRENLPRGGALEADHFFTGVPIGEKNERKASLHMALVSDAESGFAFSPELGKPGEPASELLVRALLGAIKEGRRVPREVLVRQKDTRVFLSGLAEKLGFIVSVVNSLSAVDALKDGLLSMMRDPGKFSME